MDAFSFQTITPTTCIRELKAWVSSKLHPIIIGVEGTKYLYFPSSNWIENRRQTIGNSKVYFVKSVLQGAECMCDEVAKWSVTEVKTPKLCSR